MQDGIIKGTGNSRYLKSISEFLTQYPTYNDFAAALAAGTLPIDLNGINPTGWDQQGTPLNKENLLSDETCELLGIPQTSVPDDAFKKTFNPPGTILWHGAQTAPTGYLICDGSAVSRTDYANLFSAIGTSFGSGDGSTTFSLPNLLAKFVRGAGSSGGYTATFGSTQGATSVVSLSEDDFVGRPYASGYDGRAGRVQGGKYQMIHSDVKSLSLYYVRPYNIALTPIIKY